MLERSVLIAGSVFATVVAIVSMLYSERVIGDHAYDPVEEHLYVGRAVEHPPLNTKAVVNLCKQEDPYSVDFKLYRPIDGSVAPDFKWLREVIEFIDQHRKQREVTYVHCAAGVNRSGMVVTAYLMHEHGWSRDKALAHVQARRPEIQPNPTMMRFLEEWEKELDKSK